MDHSTSPDHNLDKNSFPEACLPGTSFSTFCLADAVSHSIRFNQQNIENLPPKLEWKLGST